MGAEGRGFESLCPDHPSRSRWSVLAALLGFIFFAYVERTSLAVAAERMMPELGITQVELGWMLTAFLAFLVLALAAVFAVPIVLVIWAVSWLATH